MNQKEETWREEFRRKFITDDGDYSYIDNDESASNVIDFIEKTRKEAAREALNEVENKIDACLEKEPENFDPYEVGDVGIVAYNNGITDSLLIIRKHKEFI